MSRLHIALVLTLTRMILRPGKESAGAFFGGLWGHVELRQSALRIHVAGTATRRRRAISKKVRISAQSGDKYQEKHHKIRFA